jgi:hypothetical protein
MSAEFRREVMARVRCDRCGGRAHHAHHRRRRRVRDAHQHCPCNGLALCGTCHHHVHAHPRDALAAGWIVSAWEADPGSVPVETWYGRVRLLCDGGHTWA